MRDPGQRQANVTQHGYDTIQAKLRSTEEERDEHYENLVESMESVITYRDQRDRLAAALRDLVYLKERKVTYGECWAAAYDKAGKLLAELDAGGDS